MVTRSFDSFDDFWTSSLSGTAGETIAKMPAVDADIAPAKTQTNAAQNTYSACWNGASGFWKTLIRLGCVTALTIRLA